MARRRRLPISQVLELLEAEYGMAVHGPRFEPVDELVSCILSQHTTDATSFPTFDTLKKTWPAWEEVLRAGPERVADVIRPAGLANQKSKSIIGSLHALKEGFGEITLDPLWNWSTPRARRFLTALPGVGEKTAAIVLCFAFGRDVVPVDTHVFRVAWRYGLVPRAAGEAKAHALLDRLTPKGAAYRLHMAFIAHGRAVCRARMPECGRCVIAEGCPSRSDLL